MSFFHQTIEHIWCAYNRLSIYMRDKQWSKLEKEIGKLREQFNEKHAIVTRELGLIQKNKEKLRELAFSLEAASASLQKIVRLTTRFQGKDKKYFKRNLSSLKRAMHELSDTLYQSHRKFTEIDQDHSLLTKEEYKVES